MAESITRIEFPYDAERCLAIGANGQCQVKRVPNSNYCLMHGGHMQHQKNAAAELRNYRLSQYNFRVGEKAHSTSIKNLNEEIGILRVMLEERLNLCQTPTDLIMHHQALCQVLAQIQKTVESCHRIDMALNLLLDERQAYNLINQIIECLTKYITDPDLLSRIGTSLGEIIKTVYGERTCAVG